MLIICDFDGTVTSIDTNGALAAHFAPEASARLAGKLGDRSMTVREVLTEEMGDIRAGLDAVLEVARRIPLREGFGAFLDAAHEHGDEVVLLSSGFRQVIEPMLENAGLAGRAPLVANDIDFTADGGRIDWRELPRCDLCGEACKRGDVARLRARPQHASGPFDHVVFVGDGYSDRCGAETADRVFARASLATYLDERGEPFESYETFHDVTRALYGMHLDPHAGGVCR